MEFKWKTKADKYQAGYRSAYLVLNRFSLEEGVPWPPALGAHALAAAAIDGNSPEVMPLCISSTSSLSSFSSDPEPWGRPTLRFLGPAN
jgi:hypothetical protein